MLGAVIYASSRASLTAATSEPEGLRWDLRVYYYASQALADGVSPYVHTDLAQFSGRDDLLGCKYPPLTVAAFEPLGRLSFPRASAIYFGVQGLALAALALLWLRLVGPFALVAAAALWPYAARIDLIAGNVSLLAARFGAPTGRIARTILTSTAAAFLTFSAAVTLLMGER